MAEQSMGKQSGLPRGVPRLAFTISLLGSVLLTALPACAPAGAPAAMPAAAVPGAAVVPGIPSQSDLVTVVPFRFPEKPARGFILLPAEIDGRRGTVVLDSGSPILMLSDQYWQRTPTGGIDTLLRADTLKVTDPEIQFFVTAHTLRIGTLVYHFDPARVESAMSETLSNNASIIHDDRFNMFGQPILAWLGVPGLAPFETIIDYVHQRLILIRLDSAGHRLAAVPEYTATTTVPLIPLSDGQHWGLPVSAAGLHGNIFLDTGSPWNALSVTARERLGAHLHPPTVPSDVPIDPWEKFMLDSLRVGDRVYTNLLFANATRSVVGGDQNTLGYPFLNRLGVVGLNFRTHTLILYK